jgi:hypothetical protein
MSHHVCIDVELGDFDTEELVKELKGRERDLPYEYGLTPTDWENMLYALRSNDAARVMELARDFVMLVTGRIV